MNERLKKQRDAYAAKWDREREAHARTSRQLAELVEAVEAITELDLANYDASDIAYISEEVAEAKQKAAAIRKDMKDAE